MAKRSLTSATCILYDSADGVIHLIHHAVRFGAGKAAARETVEAEAREILAARTRGLSDVKALHVDASELAPATAYRVIGGKLTATR